MKSEINIEERKPIWIAISDFYVDNELQEVDFKIIASAIKKSPYSFKEVKEIDKKEVFPVLFYNLLSVAGNWTGSEEEWLVNKISGKIRRRTIFGRAFDLLKYFCFGGMNKECWTILEKTYLELSS